jgi:hypothetical protein
MYKLLVLFQIFKKEKLMRKLFFILFLLISICGYSQIMVPKTLTIAKLDSMPSGIYRFTKPDTVTIYKDTNVVIRVHDTTIKNIHDTIRIHDTVIRVTVCDTVAIQRLKVCPVCPAIPPQRTAIGLKLDALSKRWVIEYDDGSVSTP